MHSIESLEMMALACKAIQEVIGLKGREGKQEAGDPPDGGGGERAELRAAVRAIVARCAKTAAKLSRPVYYLILIAGHLIRAAG
jgi:hypothetical protein